MLLALLRADEEEEAVDAEMAAQAEKRTLEQANKRPQRRARSGN